MAKVLVIDDDEATRGVIEEILTRAGHVVETASGGREGLRRARENRFDVVLVDIIMPDVDGIETITELRERDPSLRIVAMSGSSPNSAGYLETARMLGADAALAKPFQKHELEATVARLLETAEHQGSGAKA